MEPRLPHGSGGRRSELGIHLADIPRCPLGRSTAAVRTNSAALVLEAKLTFSRPHSDWTSLVDTLRDIAEKRIGLTEGRERVVALRGRLGQTENNLFLP